MARLDKYSAPGAWDKALTPDNINAQFDAQDRNLAEYQKASDAATLKNLVNLIMVFGVADGGAYYRVTKVKPFTLQHIPFGDGYAIPMAHIRGLTLEDAKEQIKTRDRMKALAKQQSRSSATL